MPAEPERLKILTRELVAHEDAIQECLEKLKRLV